jgi:HK97 family phage portal protein
MADDQLAALPSLWSRIGAAVRLLRAVPTDGGARVYWPPLGNGDRGPPGNWQMNLNPGSFPSAELVAFSAVYACTSIISGDIAKLPIQVFRVDVESGARTVQRRDYYAQLMRTPNSYQTGADFMQLYVLSTLLQGNAYAYTPRNARGEVAALHVLDPRSTRPFIEPESGELFYRCGENLLAGIIPGAMIPERDIIHHRLPLLPGFPLLGVTPIFAAASSSAVGLQILRNSQSFFGNASRPSGVLTAPGKVSEPTAQRLKEDWDNNYGGPRFGKTAVLPEGLKWEPLAITAQDAQLIEQLRWSVEDVARVFRVPLFMLGDPTKATYRNTEQAARAYLSGCLSYHIEALEQRFERAFEFPLDWELKFDLSQILRAEIDVRFAAYTQALNAGWSTINEVRAQEGLEAVDGGDEPHIQMQYVPLSQSGKTPAAPAPGEPPPTNPPDAVPAGPGDETLGFDSARVRAVVRRRLQRRAA